MAKTQLVPVFDYSTLPTEAKGKLIWYAGEITRQAVTHVKSGVEMGRLLSEARELCGTSFRDWVQRECGHSARTAYRYISAYENFGECDNLSHIELSAMYELTKNEDAKKRALKLAAKGVKVTHEMAKQLVSDASEKVVEPDEEPTETGTVHEAEAEGTTPEEEAHQSPGNGMEELVGETEEEPDSEPEDTPIDYGTCPHCKGTKWTETDDGVNCSKCNHPHGEPVGDVGEGRVKPGKERSPAKLVDEGLRKYVGPCVRLIDVVAEINGGKGDHYNIANESLSSLDKSLREMRKGNR